MLNSKSLSPLLLILNLCLISNACTTDRLNLDDPIQTIQNAQALRDAQNPKAARTYGEGPFYAGLTRAPGPSSANPNFQVDQESGRVNFKADVVYFEFDQAKLTKDGRDQLEALALYMKVYPKTKLNIAGHCDDRGTEKYNLVLGQQRSNAVKAYLATQNITEDRLESFTFGKEKPAVSGADEESRSKNRRVEFAFIVPKVLLDRTSKAH